MRMQSMIECVEVGRKDAMPPGYNRQCHSQLRDPTSMTTLQHKQ